MSAEPAAGAAKTPFFQRPGLSLGLALYTLGPEVAQDLDAAFAQVAQAGYADVELPNLLGAEPSRIRAAADRAGVAISSLHLFALGGPMASGLSFFSEPSRIAEALGALGARCLVLPLPRLEEGLQPQPGEGLAEMLSRTVVAGGEEIWRRTADLLNETAAALAPFGVELAFHNHNLEFAPIGGTTGWEILTRETDPVRVRFEVDVAWVAAAGLDPVAFLQRLEGRVSQLHVKDLKPGVARNFAIRAQCAEVGEGVLDWPRILPAAAAAGAPRFYVEQEPPFDLPRLDSIRRSHAYLADLRL